MKTPSAMQALRRQSNTGKALLIVGILLIAANLRAPITALPPLLGPIREALQLGTVAAGALTTLPLLAFALVSPFSALFAREYGLEKTLFAALLAIGFGITVRSGGATWLLYLGTTIIGMGIAVGNVLLPSIVKRDFPHSIPALTGAYALSMGLAAALGSAVVVPLENHLGWRYALMAFLLLPLASVAVWWHQTGNHSAPANDTASPPHGGKVWHSPLAWQVTLFLGLNSTIYYVAISWLPTILTDSGLTPEYAGSLHGVLQLATAIPGLLLGPLMRRMRDQRLPAAVSACLSVIALVGLIALPRFAVVWSILFGIGTGAGIILGLSFIGLRARNAAQAAALSGMSQCIGYLLAATGPVAVGALHDALGSWRTPLALCAALAAAAVVFGVLAGRDRRVGD